jgi:hypothetical protein
MYTNSQHIGQIGNDRQRDALARAEQQRRAQRLRTSSKSARERHPGRARRALTWLRAAATRQRP